MKDRNLESNFIMKIGKIYRQKVHARFFFGNITFYRSREGSARSWIHNFFATVRVKILVQELRLKDNVESKINLKILIEKKINEKNFNLV